MLSRSCCLFLAVLLTAVIEVEPCASQQDTALPNLTVALDRLFEIQKQVKDIHPAFHRVYPIAVVSDNLFHVYEADPQNRHYKLAATAPDKFNVPVGTRAAMPLDFWGNRIACVITPEALDEPRGFVLVFHEFVHCYQWETCELRLKEKLGLYQAAMQRKDYMWELQYAFPYETKGLRQDYISMINALDRADTTRSTAFRENLKKRLAPGDWEYLTWQEWKEGLARYLENAIAARLGQPANHGGLEPPFTRVTFYAGGEALIRSLSGRQPAVLDDIEALYHRIAE